MQFKLYALAAFASTAVAQSMNLTAALASSSQLTSLTALLGQFPALTAQLAGLSNITLLAPSNAAISALLNSSAGAAAASNTALVQALLTYHVLNGSYATFSNTSTFIPTALQPAVFANVTGGQRVEARLSGANATIFSGLKANSTAVGTAMNFTGGYIHIIDQVLTIPQNISATAIAFNLTSAAGALTSANLVNRLDTSQDVTVFVPNNAAFQRIGSALPNLTAEQVTSILEYHVVAGAVGYSTLLRNETLTTLQGGNVTITVAGSSVFVNGARVLIPDVLVSNGVVHVIDNVLNPLNATATANGAASTGAPAFSGASSASDVPYTSGVPTPTSSINTGSIAATATSSAGSSSSSGGAWMPKPTGIGAALVAGGAIIMAL